MKAGDLVKWSTHWIEGVEKGAVQLERDYEEYKRQVGVILYRVSEPAHCYKVLWSDNDICDVHYDYLELLNESR